MKLFRFGAFEQEKPGVELADGSKLDVSAFGEDYNEKFWRLPTSARILFAGISKAGAEKPIPSSCSNCVSATHASF